MATYKIVEKDAEYIPDWEGNREETEPVKFTLRYLTNAERARCQKQVFDMTGNVTVIFDNENLIRYGVMKIEGFTVEDENGKSREVTTAQEFNALKAFPMLHLEIANEILSMNQRQGSKN